MIAILVILGLLLISLVLVELYRRFCPEGCEECNEFSSCLHCPLQGTKRCPIVNGGAS